MPQGGKGKQVMRNVSDRHVAALLRRLQSLTRTKAAQREARQFPFQAAPLEVQSRFCLDEAERSARSLSEACRLQIGCLQIGVPL